jgi:hypothetical protein
MVRRCILCMMLGLATSVAALSQHLSGYELEREMPVFLDQLKAELTYPMAWGNSPVKILRSGANRHAMPCWMPCLPLRLALPTTGLRL